MGAQSIWGGNGLGRLIRPEDVDRSVGDPRRRARPSCRHNPRVPISGVLTAAVTPFESDGRIDEEAFVRLLAHLGENGSDGVVVAGTTGESSTLDDDEKIRLFELAVQEGGDLFVVAGTGSNDTAHTVQLTERASATGVDAVLVVTPYYNKPPLRGIKAHYQAVAAVTDKPIILYNIPSRVVVDLPNDFLHELGEIDGIAAVKQARETDIAAIDGIDLLAGNDDRFAEILDAGGTGGILTASHVVGRELRRMIDEPDNRWAIHDQLMDVFDSLGVAPLTMSLKAAMNLLGHDMGTVRLPLVDCNDEEREVIRGMLERHGLLSAV
jgi:4-hydroxy-tetrahydrodipicolinate synthase